MAKKKKAYKKPELKSFLIQRLRAACQRWPAYYETLNKVRQEVHIIAVTPCTDGRYRIETSEGIWFSSAYLPNLGRRIVYQCEACKEWFLKKDKVRLKNGKLKYVNMVVVDHTTPVVGEEGFTTWDSYVKGMFPEHEGCFQVLCRSCHALKSDIETAARAEHKRKLKGENTDGNVEGKETRRRSQPPTKGAKPKVTRHRAKKSARCVRRLRLSSLRHR